MSDYIDVTVGFQDGMMCFPTDPQCSIFDHWAIKNGDVVNLSILNFGSHTGTHIDAPKHFCDNGKTIDQLDIKNFIGKTKIFDLSHLSHCIDVPDVKELDIQKDDIVFFKTKNSQLMQRQKFQEDFVFITPAAATWLAEKEILTLGFDYLSVEEYGGGAGYGAHYALLGAGVVIIEGLNLIKVCEGTYEIISLPMLITGGNGSPIRVLLRKI
jgi:arylformamidase